MVTQTRTRAKQEQWVSGKQGACVLNRNSGRSDIAPDYVRLLASPRHGRVRSRPVDGRTREYLLADLEAIVVKRIKKKEGEDDPART